MLRATQRLAQPANELFWLYSPECKFSEIRLQDPAWLHPHGTRKRPLPHPGAEGRSLHVAVVHKDPGMRISPAVCHGRGKGGSQSGPGGKPMWIGVRVRNRPEA
jgi:hypothetical protein